MRFVAISCLMLSAIAPVCAVMAPVAYADEIRSERIAFHKGASSAVTSGQIKGYESVDYLLNVKAGQKLSIALTTPNTSTYFNLMEPNQLESAIYTADVGGNSYQGVAATSGDYRIRVYQMRNAARRGQTATYKLTTSVG